MNIAKLHQKTEYFEFMFLDGSSELEAMRKDSFIVPTEEHLFAVVWLDLEIFAVKLEIQNRILDMPQKNKRIPRDEWWSRGSI